MELCNSRGWRWLGTAGFVGSVSQQVAGAGTMPWVTGVGHSHCGRRTPKQEGDLAPSHRGGWYLIPRDPAGMDSLSPGWAGGAAAQ